jgi:hypothetical protein
MLPGIVPVFNRAAAVVTDPLVVDDFTSLLLHLDIGAEAATAWSDYSLKTPKGATIVFGNATLAGSGIGLFSAPAFFDGSGDYAQFAAHADYNFGSGDFTIDSQFYVAAGAGTFRTMLGQLDASATPASHSFSLRLSNTDQLYATVNQGSTSITVTGGAAIAAFGWHHAAFVRAGNALKIFLDGVQQGSDVAISGAINSSASKLGIGSLGEYTGGQFWNGYLDEVRISKGIARWTSNFTPPAVPYKYPAIGGNDSNTKLLLHADAPHGTTTFTDQSLSAKGNVTAGGSAVVSQAIAKFGSAAMYFSGGAGDRFNVAGSADWNLGGSNFTIDFWAAIGAYSNATGGHLSACVSAFDANNYYRFLFYNSSFTPQFIVVDGGAATFAVNAADGSAPAGEGFVHWAIVRNGTNWRIYKNGVSVGEIIQAYTIPSYGRTLQIGCGDAGNYPFNGYIDEFRLSRVARWTTNFVPPKAPYSS